MIVFRKPAKRGETWQLTFRISASRSNLLCFHNPHNPRPDGCCCSWSGGNFRRRHESAEQTRSRTKGRKGNGRIETKIWGSRKGEQSQSTVKIYLTIWCRTYSGRNPRLTIIQKNNKWLEKSVFLRKYFQKKLKVTKKNYFISQIVSMLFFCLHFRGS